MSGSFSPEALKTENTTVRCETREGGAKDLLVSNMQLEQVVVCLIKQIQEASPPSEQTSANSCTQGG